MPSNKVSTSAPNYDNKDHINDELANGPLENRSCRDVLCCLLFIAFMGGMIAVAAYGIHNGNPTLLARGYDYDGNMCGIAKGYEDYKYLYFANPVENHLTETLCLKTCPTGNSNSSSSTLQCKANSLTSDCAAKNDNFRKGSIYIYSSVNFVSRVCIPTVLAEAGEESASAASNAVLNANMFQEWISDIKTTWPVIAISVAVAFAIGLFYMVLMRYCSGVLTWLAIIAFITCSAVLGWRFFKEAKNLQATISDSTSSDDRTTIQKSVRSDKIIAYICWAVAAGSALMVLCLYSRIKLAIAILKAAADYVKETMIVFLVPVVAVLFLAAWFAYWAVTAVFLVSAGDAVQAKNSAFGTFNYDKKLQYYMIYHLFGLLWFAAFVAAATQFIIASSTCIWYFSQGTGQGASGTVRKSVYRFFRYHFGSIAFGSLILAVVQLIRIILSYMEAQAKKAGAHESKVAQFAFKCLQCYLACFERFIKFLNKNAYIQIALTGKNFCLAAKDGFMLAMGNPLRYSVLYGIAGVFVLFGKVFISALTGLAAFLVITRWDKFSSQLYSPVIPTLIVLVFAYAIGNVFLTVYGMAAETILACFVLDEEINKKKNAPPRHCPESLKSFLDMHAKKNN